MKKTIIIAVCLLLGCLNGAVAQGKFAKVFAGSLPGESAIQLKWILWMPSSVQYQVLRRQMSEKTFTRLTTKPIQPVALPLKDDPKQAGPVAEARRNYAQFRKSTPTKKAELQFMIQLFGMNAYTDNDFARAAGMYFVDNTVVAGQTYQYSLSATYNGKEYALGLTDPVRAGNYQPLTAPVGLTAKQVATRRIALNWNLRPDVMAYNIVRRAGAGPEVQLNRRPVAVIEAVNGKQPTTQFTDTDSTLRVGETYEYRIVALDPFVTPGLKSEPARLTIKDLDPPVAARQLHVRLLDRQVRLGWIPSSSPDCRGYRVFRTLSLDKPMQPLDNRLLNRTDTTFTDVSAVEGATYYYVVKAEDGAGNQAASNVTQIIRPDLTPPRMPAGLTVRTDTLGHVLLTWQRGSEPDLKGYFVYQALQNQADNYAQLQLNPLTVNTFRDTLPRNNQNLFYYRVTAIDHSENESPPALIVVRLPDRQAPRAPTLTNLTATADSVAVSWQPSVSTDIRTYQVLRRNEADPKPAFQPVGRTAGQPQFVDRRLPGGTYSYALTATDSTGNVSKMSLPRAVQVMGNTALTAPRDVKIRLDERGKKLTVTWTAPPQTADFAGYRVLARTGDAPFRAVSDLLPTTPAVLTDWEPEPATEIAVVALSQTGQQAQSQPVKAEPDR